MIMHLLSRLRSAAKQQDYHGVLRAFQKTQLSMFKQADDPMKASVYLCLLEALTHLQKFHGVLSVVKDMQQQHIAISANVHGLVLLALANTGRWQEAVQHLLEVMPADQRGIEHFHALSNEALSFQQPDVAKACLDAVAVHKLAWDWQTWSLALRTEASLGQPAQVHHLIRNVKESPFSSHISVRATVVGSLLSCGLLDDAAAELTALLRVWQQQHSRAGGQQTASRLSTVSRQHAAQHRQLMQSCHALVHAAERAGDHAVLQSALHHMQEAGLQLDTAIHNSMLRAAAARGADASSLQSSIDGMVQSGVHPDQHTFTIMLRAHKQRGNAQAAAAVMAQLLDSGFMPSLQAFNALLEAWASQGNPFEAALVYSKMKQRSISPDLCTFIALFESLWRRDTTSPPEADAQAARADVTAAASPEEAERMQRMEVHMFHQLCHALGEQLDTWTADMRSATLQHSPASFTSLVQAYGRLERAQDMVQLLTAHPEMASAQAYSAALGACARQGRVDEGLMLRKCMADAGIAPTAHTYTALMNAHLTADSAIAVPQLLLEMHEAGVQPTSWTYTALIKAHLKLGEVRDAMTAVDTMQGSGIVPNAVTWDAVVEGAKQQGHYELQHAAQERMGGNSEPWQLLAQTFTYYGSEDDDDSNDLW